MAGLDGCEGGLETSVSDFVQNYGFELLDAYSYQFEPKSCKWLGRKKVEANKMGRIRLDKPKLSMVWPGAIEEELKKSPLIMSIRVSQKFTQYGGGVDDGAGCGSYAKGYHSVLLVGSGRQDGHEYWLIRNSYGFLWGEMGYYRVRKGSDCLVEFNTYKLKAMTEEGDGPKYRFYYNPEYEVELQEVQTQAE